MIKLFSISSIFFYLVKKKKNLFLTEKGRHFDDNDSSSL